MTVERVDDAGRWVDGMLVDPAPGWLDGIAEAPEATDPVALLVSALRDPLANLTPSSAATTVRTAILNQRAALDALLAALETP